MGQVSDVRQCVTMDLKRPGSRLYQIGITRNELGGSHFAKIRQLLGGEVPQVDPELARRVFAAVHQAITVGLVRACHDLSEGGLAVAAAEMAFAGGCGAVLNLTSVPHDLHDLDQSTRVAALLFSESNTRFVCEVDPEQQEAFVTLMSDNEVPCGDIGSVEPDSRFMVRISEASDRRTLIDVPLPELKNAWQEPLRW